MARRVLVVEDDRDIRQAVADMLELSGYAVRTARHGGEALALLDEWWPGAIVLDILMPEMDGPAFLAALATREGAAAIPVVILSALRDLEERAAPLPGAAVVAKPFDLDDLLRALDRAWTEEG